MYNVSSKVKELAMNSFSINHDTFKKLSALLVYIGIALLAMSDSGIQLLILFEIGPGSRTLRLIAMGLLFTKVIFTRYTKKEFFILAPIAVLALYNYTVSGTIYGVYTILVVACMKDIDYSMLFKVLFYSTLSAVVFVGILSFFGIGSPVSLTENFGREMVETRYCLGLHHPNIWHFAVARCIVFYCIAYYDKLNIFLMIALLLFNYFIYVMSASRTGLLAVSTFLMLLLFYKYFKKLMHCLFVKICILGGMLGVYAVYIHFTRDLMNGGLYGEIFNYKITTGRIQQAIDFLSTHPIRLFASRFPDDGTLFDWGSLRMFYESGYLWAGIFFIAFFLLIFFALKNNRDIVVAACVFFLLYTLYESDPATRPTYNIVVFFLPLLIFPSSAASFATSFDKTASKGTHQTNGRYHINGRERSKENNEKQLFCKGSRP